jgi:hypothetical protein
MLLDEMIAPWPPRIMPSNDGIPVNFLVLRNVFLKDRREAPTPHLCLELKDKAGWFYYSYIFSDDRHFLERIWKVLSDNAGKTMIELGGVACPDR